MLDKATLSKQKYIYCVYAGKDDSILDGKLHIERFPVIYINSKYVYFKFPGDEALTLEAISSVKDSLDSLTDYDIDCLRWNRKYFWVMDKNAPETLKEIKEKRNQKMLKEKKEKARQDLDNAKRLYEQALDIYRRYEEN